MSPKRPTRLSPVIPALAVLALAAAAAAPASSAEALPSGGPGGAGLVAFTRVTVLPMDRRGFLEDQTVIVRGDRIAAVGPSDRVRIPAGARRIDGRRRFLMPGLADMHVHTWDPAELALFLANGVTTIRNMFGDPRHVTWREEIRGGERLGPEIVTAGPIIDGSPPVWPTSDVVETAEEARRVVRKQKSAGYDFVKVYAGLTREAYDAVVDEAKRLGLPVAGHVPDAVGLARALQAGQSSIEHLSGYSEAAQAVGSPHRTRSGPMALREWEHLDARNLEVFAQATARAGTWNCPTLVVIQRTAVTEGEAEAHFSRPEMRFLPRNTLALWREGRDLSPELVRSVRATDGARKHALAAIHRAGGRILLGTDCLNRFVVHGFAIHEEMDNLVKAGLTPWEALRAGTSGAAEFLGAEDRFGAVREGLRADLILLEANPLEEVGHVARRAGVMVRGRWLPEDRLRAMLERQAAWPAPESVGLPAAR